MEELLKQGRKFIDNVWNHIAFDDNDNYINLYESCFDLYDSEEGAVFFNDDDVIHLTVFIQFQKEIHAKILEGDRLHRFIDSYYALDKRRILDAYPSFKTHIDDFLINEYPTKWDGKFDKKDIEHKFSRDFTECLTELERMLLNYPTSLKGVNIQQAFINLNYTFGSLIEQKEYLYSLNVYDFEGKKEDRLVNALKMVERLDIDFKSSIGKSIPTSLEDVQKAIDIKQIEYREHLRGFRKLTNYGDEQVYELVNIDKSKFKNIIEEIETILEKLRNYGRPIMFRDYMSKSDDLKRREEIFLSELEISIENKENIALVAIIENPKARKYRWEVTGAFDLDKDNWEFGAYESNTLAAAYAYNYAKKFQVENKLFTRFISLTNNGDDEDEN